MASRHIIRAVPMQALAAIGAPITAPTPSILCMGTSAWAPVDGMGTSAWVPSVDGMAGCASSCRS